MALDTHPMVAPCTEETADHLARLAGWRARPADAPAPPAPPVPTAGDDGRPLDQTL